MLAIQDTTDLNFSGLKQTSSLGKQQSFKNLAEQGKTSVDWFFRFKLHLVVNDKGELLNFVLTSGNTDDRTPVPKLLQQLFGKVFADRGYVSQKPSQQLLIQHFSSA